jgi:predicted metal-dependent phosphoesterase TrpH
MRPLLVAGAAAVGLALALGWAVDSVPPLEVRIGNGTLLCGDPHVHTYLSFHAGTPLVHLTHAQRRGLDFIVFSEHNRVGGGAWGQEVARLVGSPVIVVEGEEVTNPKYHINALGISKSIPYTTPADEVVAEIHRQGGLASANHPVEKYWPALVPLMGERRFDVFEYINLGPWNKGDHPQVEAFVKNMTEAGFLEGVGWVGTSDAHLGANTGQAKACVVASERTWGAIAAEMKAGRSAATIGGRFFGPMADELNANPQAVAKITQEPALWTKVISHIFLVGFAVAMLGKRGPWGRRGPPPGSA